MAHTIRNKSRLIARVRRIKGQVEAVERALESEIGCADVLMLVASLRGAITGLSAEVMEEHIRNHVVDLEESNFPFWGGRRQVVDRPSTGVRLQMLGGIPTSHRVSIEVVLRHNRPPRGNRQGSVIAIRPTDAILVIDLERVKFGAGGSSRDMRTGGTFRIIANQRRIPLDSVQKYTILPPSLVRTPRYGGNGCRCDTSSSI